MSRASSKNLRPCMALERIPQDYELPGFLGGEVVDDPAVKVPVGAVLTGGIDSGHLEEDAGRTTTVIVRSQRYRDGAHATVDVWNLFQHPFVSRALADFIDIGIGIRSHGHGNVGQRRHGG